MGVSTTNNFGQMELGAAVFAPVAPEDFYEAVLDVRGFPAWAPGVRRVGVLSGEGRNALRVGGLVPRLHEEGPERVGGGGEPVPAALVVRRAGPGPRRGPHAARPGGRPGPRPGRPRRG